MKKKDTTSGKTSEWDPAPEGRVTPQEVQQKEFRVARFGAGYRMREVDEFLDQVTDAMNRVCEEVGGSDDFSTRAARRVLKKTAW